MTTCRGCKYCQISTMSLKDKSVEVGCSPYIENPTMIYAIKKFDVMDLLKEQYRTESEDKT